MLLLYDAEEFTQSTKLCTTDYFLQTGCLHTASIALHLQWLGKGGIMPIFCEIQGKA